ncbi:hydrolase [Lentibacillus sp. L22]|uniref:hydrolase n=1 Tax=Lentibacillus TaxID=175304 RepID=UPI0022B1E75B|nr:hydrolase [Lentibacillus daqui]
MEKKKYFVNMGSQEISSVKYGNNEELVIYATEDEARELRGKMEGMNDADIGAFWRAHVPIMPYHHDQANDDYDSGITEALKMIYDLGNEETKRHITDMGVLGDRPL